MIPTMLIDPIVVVPGDNESEDSFYSDNQSSSRNESSIMDATTSEDMDVSNDSTSTVTINAYFRMMRQLLANGSYDLFYRSVLLLSEQLNSLLMTSGVGHHSAENTDALEGLLVQVSKLIAQIIQKAEQQAQRVNGKTFHSSHNVQSKHHTTKQSSSSQRNSKGQSDFDEQMEPVDDDLLEAIAVLRSML